MLQNFLASNVLSPVIPQWHVDNNQPRFSGIFILIRFSKIRKHFHIFKKVPTSGEASPITKDRGGNYRAAVLSTNVVDIFAFD